MANILSQDEVDELLGAVERGELISEDEQGKEKARRGSVQDYNFRRPNLITRDQLRGFTNLHEDFAREFQASLSIFLRTNVELRLVSAEQQQYNEFIFALSDTTHVVLFSMEPLLGMALLEVNLPLVFGMVDLLLGGEGDVETAIRKLTEVEIAIVEPIVEMAFTRLQESLKNFIEVHIKQDRYESSPEYVQAAPPDAPMVVLTFDAKVGLANGILNICYPLPMVQAMLRELHGRAGQLDNYYGKSSPEEARHKIMTAFMGVPLRTSAWLGEAQVKAKDWLSLKKGDIIVLGQDVTSPVVVRVESEKAFCGVPGQRNGNLAVKLKTRIETEHYDNLDNLFDD